MNAPPPQLLLISKWCLRWSIQLGHGYASPGGEQGRDQPVRRGPAVLRLLGQRPNDLDAHDRAAQTWIMGKSWKCRIGWHAFVRRPNDGDPNHKMCARCHKWRDFGGLWGGIANGTG